VAEQRRGIAGKLDSNQLLGIVVMVLVIGLSAWMGLRARGTMRDLSASRRTWEDAASQLSTVQQQFRVPTTSESSSLIAEGSRLSALGITSDEKLGLVDLLGRLAEAMSLSSVRVNVVPVADSAVIPARQVVGSSIRPASYALAVEFVGRFADAQKFVSSLPPSVSISSLTASRREGAARYSLILSVYEIDANPGD
jgi:hypothetical protein